MKKINMYFGIFLLFGLCIHFPLRPMLKTVLSLVPLTLNVSMKYIPGAKDTVSQALPKIAINLLHYPIEKTEWFRWTTTPWPILGTLMFCNPYIYEQLITYSSLPKDTAKNVYKILISSGITMFVLFNTLYPLYHNAEFNKGNCSTAVIYCLLLYGPPIANLCLC